MEEPEVISSPISEKNPTKKNIATLITLGIIFGFLVVIFAITIILINLIPVPDKLSWLLTNATFGNWLLLIGTGLLEFFFALTASIYIWKRGRNYLMTHI
ncbi:MAG: hypothetical protein EU536_01545 [Promethearchaeota archaeon]|nr:MAG: hypothetical protein EU536_01545 [Candidatus Lokiarchaeota archaeon]